MKSLIILISSLVFITTINAQTITWSKVYGSPDSVDIAHTIKQVQDGGYIVIGHTYISTVILYRIDIYGDIIWSKNIPDSICIFKNTTKLDIEPGIDSGFLFCSTKYINYDSMPLSIIWLNDSGDIYRNLNYYIISGLPDIVQDYPTDIDKISNDYFIIAGNTRYGGYGNDVGFILKINNNGDSLWTIHSLAEEMYFTSVARGNDASYLSVLDGHPMYYRTVEKFDSLGQHQSTLCSLGSFIKEIEMLKDSNFVFVSRNSGPYAIVKITENLDTVWTRPGIGYNDFAPCSDGGFVVTGSNNNDLFLTKFNTNGDSLWTVTYGGGGVDVGRCVEQTSDGGYIICGSSTSYGTGSSDFYIIKTDSLGYAMGVEEEPYPVIINNNGITVENVSSDAVKISFISSGLNDFSFRLYDVSGRTFEKPLLISNDDNQTSVLIQDLRPGQYFFKIEMENNSLEGKFSVF